MFNAGLGKQKTKCKEKRKNDILHKRQAHVQEKHLLETRSQGKCSGAALCV